MTQELDVQVAEKPMGLVRCAHPSHSGLGWVFDDGLCASLPPYSSDIASAWEVVERMREQGWRFKLRFLGRHQGWECTFSRPDNHGHVGYARKSPDAAHVICRAALLAVGEQP